MKLPKEKEVGWSVLVGHNHAVAGSNLTYNIQRHSTGVSVSLQTVHQTCHQKSLCIFILTFTSLKIFLVLPKSFNNTCYGFLKFINCTS